MLAESLERCVASLTLVALAGCGGSDLGRVAVRPSQEQRTPDGDRPYTPSTQSLLRGHSWMEDVDAIRIQTDTNDNATVRMESQDRKYYVEIRNLPLRHIVPRLHYKPAVTPDDFDAFNLMLAEYSRNSISVPQGRAGDSMAHYQTNMTDTVPWRLAGDFEFEPNPSYRPIRIGVVNNCLRPSLWELNAVDRSGEIYHSWFDMPKDHYYRLVADVNGLEEDFARQALDWKEDEVPLDLSRLRTEIRSLGTVPIGVVDEEVSFSSQDSRRKLNQHYVRYENDGELHSPTRLSDLYRNKSAMSSFIEPGIYSLKEEDLTEFDFIESRKLLDTF